MTRFRMGTRVRLSKPITDAGYENDGGWYEHTLVPEGEEGVVTDSRGTDYVSYEVRLDRDETYWIHEHYLEAV